MKPGVSEEAVLEHFRRGGGLHAAQLNFGIGRTKATRLRDVAGARFSNLNSCRPEFVAIADSKIGEVYEAAVRESALRHLSKPSGRVEWKPERGWNAIAFMADIHAGTDGIDYAAFDRDVRLIQETPGLHCVLGGDVIDNHIKHLAAIIAHQMSPSHQWDWLERIVNSLREKLVAMVGGNHEAWTCAVSGFDPLRTIAQKLALPYDADEIELIIDCPAGYVGCVRHKYRFNSVYNPEHSVRQLWTFGDVAFDFGVVCDKHVSTVAPFYRHRKQRWVLRPGSYQVLSKFARQVGFHGSAPVTPVLVFHSERREFHAFDSVEWGARVLTSLRAAEVRHAAAKAAGLRRGARSAARRGLSAATRKHEPEKQRVLLRSAEAGNRAASAGRVRRSADSRARAGSRRRVRVDRRRRR